MKKILSNKNKVVPYDSCSQFLSSYRLSICCNEIPKPKRPPRKVQRTKYRCHEKIHFHTFFFFRSFRPSKNLRSTVQPRSVFVRGVADFGFGVEIRFGDVADATFGDFGGQIADSFVQRLRTKIAIDAIAE
jgi:hypothetical protein